MTDGMKNKILERESVQHPEHAVICDAILSGCDEFDAHRIECGRRFDLITTKLDTVPDDVVRKFKANGKASLKIGKYEIKGMESRDLVRLVGLILLGLILAKEMGLIGKDDIERFTNRTDMVSTEKPKGHQP